MRRWLASPHGCVIDLRPADVHGTVAVGLPDGGIVAVGELVVEDERRARHGAADAAVREVVERRLFTRHGEQQFPFFYYPDSADELRDYVAAKWRNTHLDPATHRLAIAASAKHPEGRLWLREQVGIRVLQPVTAPYVPSARGLRSR
ncbi:MAG TPA: hypothetical protein VMO26_19735 [Vicinamibacterales bacterium]|nr:hypothetical protein [Vicinamibacterales bacterium]